MSGTVLVVDDDPDIRETLSEILSDEGYRVDSASDGREALEYLLSHPPPCVILLDLMMPVMSGMEFRRVQRADPRLEQIPVVAVSASRNLGSIAEDLDRIDFLPKPIQLDDLFESVERYCERG